MAKEKSGNFFSEFISAQKSADVVDFEELAKEDGYYVTENLALNAIMSGDFYKGVPKAKPSFIVGESGSGKSYFTKCICRDAIKNHTTKSWDEAKLILEEDVKAKVTEEMKEIKASKKEIEAAVEDACKLIPREDIKKELAKYKNPEKVQVIWWDVEDAYEDMDEVIASGIPTTNLTIPKYRKDKKGNNILWSIESWHISAKKYVEFVRKFKEKNPDYEFIFVLDSLGELPSMKEITDVDREDSVSDMGSRAKIWKARLRPLMQMMRELKITFLGINHVHDEPANPYAVLPAIPGGHYLKFVAQRILWVRAKNIKNEEANKGVKKFNGINIVLFNYKNRKVLKGTHVEATLTPKGGMHKYADTIKLCPKLFPEVDQKGLQVYYQWAESKTDEQVKEEINLKTGVGLNDIKTLKEKDEYLVTMTKSLWKDELKELFDFVDKGDEKGTIIIKVIAKKYKKAKLYDMGDKFFTPALIDAMNEEIKGWMQLSSPTGLDDEDETLFDEDEEAMFDEEFGEDDFSADYEMDDE